MRRSFAELSNAFGSRLIDKGKTSLGVFLYKVSAKADPRWSVPWYNLGLHAKNTGRWKESLRFNQRALELDSEDQAAWWNLGIAATALHDWPEARRAWRSYGIEIPGESGEVLWEPGQACVRLDPRNSGEVVWGERLDPARIVILNVPLPESGHRFQDIVLNDGASNGSRVDEHGNKVPVFDELSIWKVSDYSTFRVKLQVPDDEAERRLVESCHMHQLGIEDWSTIRFVCADCSRANLGPHECVAKPLENGTRRFGFGAKSDRDLLNVLHEWTSLAEGVEFDKPDLLLPAVPT